MLLVVSIGTAAVAQTAEPELADDQDAMTPLAAMFQDIAEWENVAQRAEESLGTGVTTTFALNRLRDELFLWRETFADKLADNQARITTVDSQLEALGAPPESGEEDPQIAARRAELDALRQSLATPDSLVAEAHARANGLLAEIDTQARAQFASRLLVRDASPLNPTHWGAAIAAFGASLQLMWSDMAAGIRTKVGNGTIWSVAPLALIGIVAGLVMMLRARGWVRGMRDGLGNRSPQARALWSFILSLGQMVLPLIGLTLFTESLQSLDVLSSRADKMFGALFSAVFVIIVARWLNDKLFPPGPAFGPLSFAPESNDRIRRAGITLSYGLAAIVFVAAMMELVDAARISVAVMLFPLLLFLAFTLYQLGNALRSPPVDDPNYSGTGGRVRSVIGRLTMGVALAAPVFAALGYVNAAIGLFRPVVLTLAILGVVVVLQRLVSDIYDSGDADEADAAGPLMPVLIGLGVGILALPFLALAWGARVTDLFEIWARISAGFAVGDTRISPSDFMTFLLVFAIGYVLTRFVQATLRNSVLPRTKLDLGGQNAVRSGVGYVGIFLAGLFAITSAGIDLTSLAFVAGALSLGIGFGLQNIVQNFVSGIILLIERPIAEGDMIEVNGQMGFVRDISVRSTRIETFDRTDVIIPNADLVSGQVINWTQGNPVGRLIVPVGVAYGTDVEKVRGILAEIAEKHPMSLMDPPPQVFFMGFGASSLDFEIRVHLRDVNWKVVTLSEMNYEINARFAEAGIEVPFPQQDLWLRNPETLNRPEET
ncbi:DUF3772 domain-containing protein [Yoonia sp. R2331]|uniref:DUF3772 domain-containing protein n=1 Tax=Yoonia sp. R2331 TaxID=3237238 RepID=UPI0034E406FE